MKLLLLDWNSFGNKDFISACRDLDIQVTCYPFDGKPPRRDSILESKLTADFAKEQADAVFSFNYFPIVSTVCNSLSLKYISWVYDAPHVTLYSYTIIQPCNLVFLFDRAEYLKFHYQGINTVHYLPLAANPARISKFISQNSTSFDADISFIGSLYSEECAYPKTLSVAPDGVESIEWLKQEYIVNRRATSQERIELINKAANHGNTFLFTGSDTSVIDKRVKTLGRVDYYDEAPLIFANSKINLCMTLKSIHTGIPLRVFDILASSGLLLMNHQSDMDDFFTPGEDYFIYENIEDFERTIDRILSMDTEKIKTSAYQKICESHTYHHRIKHMLEFL